MIMKNGVITDEPGVLDEITLYPAYANLGAEITGDGTTRYTGEVTQTNASEEAAEANPAWSHESLRLDFLTDVELVLLYAELHWAMKVTNPASPGGYAKWQISGDGAVTFVDITDNVEEAGIVYADKERKGVLLPIYTIKGGNGNPVIRLCTWVIDADSVESKIREDTSIKLVVRRK